MFVTQKRTLLTQECKEDKVRVAREVLSVSPRRSCCRWIWKATKQKIPFYSSTADQSECPLPLISPLKLRSFNLTHLNGDPGSFLISPRRCLNDQKSWSFSRPDSICWKQVTQTIVCTQVPGTKPFSWVRTNLSRTNKGSLVELAALCKIKGGLKKAEKRLEAITEVNVCSKSTQQDEMLRH